MKSNEREALVLRVPVHVLVRDALGVGRDLLLAVLALLGEQAHVAGQAVRVALLVHVPVAAQLRVALDAAEVVHVPVALLRVRVLLREDHLQHDASLTHFSLFQVKE